jgi:hypothetical protein
MHSFPNALCGVPGSCGFRHLRPPRPIVDTSTNRGEVSSSFRPNMTTQGNHTGRETFVVDGGELVLFRLRVRWG